MNQKEFQMSQENAVSGSLVAKPWSAKSGSDPAPKGLTYATQQEAQKHADTMNALIDTWEQNPGGLWNKDYWKSKPLPWTVHSE